MSNDKAPAIPVLWFTASGAGPNEMALLVKKFRHPEMANSIGLCVTEVPDGMVIGDTVGAMIGGGFYMEREQAAELHRVLGEWLAAALFGTEGQQDPRGDHRE